MTNKKSVIFGVGSWQDFDAFQENGVHLLLPPEYFKILWQPFISEAIMRPGDTVVVVKSDLLTQQEVMHIAEHGVKLQAIGHDPITIKNYEDVATFRALTADIDMPKTIRGYVRRTKTKYVLTPTKKDMILALWNSNLTRDVAFYQIQLLMEEPVSLAWVKQTVRKLKQEKK